jgi:hypothetical protein
MSVLTYKGPARAAKILPVIVQMPWNTVYMTSLSDHRHDQLYQDMRAHVRMVLVHICTSHIHVRT